MGNREMVVLHTVVDKRDARARQSRFAYPVRQYWCFLAQVRTDDKYGVSRLKFRERAAQPGNRGIIVLIREITLAQPMIDVGSGQLVRDPRQQMIFFQGRARCRQYSDFACTAVSQHTGQLFQRGLPIDVLPVAVHFHARSGQAIVAVDALVTEPVAIRNPGLVNLFVLTRHDALHGATQYVRIQV